MNPRADAETVATTQVGQGAASPRPVRVATAMEDEGRFVPGTTLVGRYRIIGLLGRGGMGEVYRATDLLLGQSVALKFLPDSASTNPLLLERFRGEVRIARQVSHPGVCRVYDIGEAEGLPFISMEYVDGEDLGTLLQRIGRLPGDKAVETARQICAGLAAAHAKGIIHRDLKPQNIMMNRRGEAVIMDFGLAALAEQVSGLEARHGTPAYMAPEQLKGGEVTAKSDIYALGLVLYELFTGKRAFQAANVADMIAAQESGQFASLTSTAADADPAVERVIRRCLDPEPARRPANPLAVSAALPGGDPLSAALAAGETPSPELVASAGKAEGLARKYGVLCLAVVMAGVFAGPFIKQRTTAFYRSGLEMPPDVLRHQARRIAAEFGYPAKPADSAIWLAQRPHVLRYLRGVRNTVDHRAALNAEAPVLAIYREASSPMAAPPAGQLSFDNPAPLQPGMVSMELEGHGYLRAFIAVPQADDGAVDPLDAAVLFRAANLDISKFTEAAPERVPLSATDRLVAFRGPHPAIANAELKVEVGWWRGRITHGRVIGPWTAEQAESRGIPGISRFRDAAQGTIAIAGLCVAAWLARRNWRQGRGDRRGALRVAAAVFAIFALAWFGMAHLTPAASTISMFFGGLTNALWQAAVLWLLYIALEPAVRARWPHAMVTWTRLLAGRWRDPQVGAHVLIGAAGGVLLLYAVLSPDIIDPAGEGLNTTSGLYLLNGTRAWLASMLVRTTDAMRFGFIVFFGVFCIRTIVRKDWATVIVAGLIFPVFEGDVTNAANWMVTFSLFFMLFSAITFVLLRVGLLASIAGVFFLNLVNGITLGTDWTAWNAPAGIATMMVALGVAGLAFRQSLGGRDLFGDDRITP